MAALQQSWDKIQLAAKVIGHISQGMYRSPSGALKELISNAYDAGATRVKIHTGFPRFAEFTCQDNGTGIHPDEFKRLMKGGIGDSTKQQSLDVEEVGMNGRPIIGRLGVGMLSLAQVCSEFTLVSHHAASQKAFRAIIRFPPYTREQIDKVRADAEAAGKKYVTSGEYTFDEITFQEREHGLRVTTIHLRETFKKTMSKLENLAYLKRKKRKETYPSFKEYIESVSSPELSSFFFAAPYDSLLYGLSLASPLPYLESKKLGTGLEPVLLRIPELHKIHETLKSYDFTVEVDNIELRRPIILPSNKARTMTGECEIPKTPTLTRFTIVDGTHEEEVEVREYVITVVGEPERFRVFYFDYSARVNGRPLHFSGYVFMQTTRLFPKEFQGILIRLRQVAIGEYDANIMTYPQAEGPRFSMLSSEIFVHKGLDDGLKVDRDGFNTLDPHYIRLQAFIHSLLHEKIFPESWGEEKKRNTAKRKAKTQERTKKFASKLRSVTKQAITKVEVVKERAGADEELATVDEDSGTITINEAHPDAKMLLGAKRHRIVATQVFSAFEIANKERTPEKRKEVFYKLLEGVFDA